MKKLAIMFFSLLVLVLLASCDQVNNLVGLIPSFEDNLPNIFEGTYASFESDYDMQEGIYTERFVFVPTDNSVTYRSVADGNSISKGGKYSYSYSSFQITDCNGYLTIDYGDGDIEVFSFLYHATALEGPVSLTLSQNNTSTIYYYWD